MMSNNEMTDQRPMSTAANPVKCKAITVCPKCETPIQLRGYKGDALECPSCKRSWDLNYFHKLPTKEFMGPQDQGERNMMRDLLHYKEMATRTGGTA